MKTSLILSEWDIYGSAAQGKFAIRQPKEELVYDPLEYDRGSAFYRIVGEKQYHLTDHLGNVRATVSDIKEPSGGGFLTNTITAASFYPFGFMEEGRFFFGGKNRWGMQGQERDDEIRGLANIINYKYRMYDPRSGRFFAIDPIAAKYPHNSSYAFSENRVIDGVELEGLEFLPINRSDDIKRAEVAYLKATFEATVDGIVYFLTNADELFGDIGVSGASGGDGKSYGWSINNGIYETNHYDVVDADFEGHLRFWGGAADLATSAYCIYNSMKVFKSIIKSTTNLKRYSLADNFYRINGFTDDNHRASHLMGIDFDKPVFTKPYEKGTILEQWAYVDKNTGEVKIGNYFTKLGADKNKLGISLKNRKKVKIKLLENTEFLQSTANDFKALDGSGEIYKGGETQLFSPNVKYEIVD